MSSLSPRGTRIALALLVAVAFGIRLGMLVAAPDPDISPGLVAFNGDMARNLVDKGEFFKINDSACGVTRTQALQEAQERIIDPEDLDYRCADANPDYLAQLIEPPGEAALLAGFWAVTGDQRYDYVQVLQIVVDSGLVLVVWWLALQLFSRPRAALFAAALYATFLPLAKSMTAPHLIAWGVIATLAATALFVRALREERHQLAWLIALGAVVGIGMYFRPVILVPIALAVVASRWVGLRRAAVLAAVPLAVAAVLLLPWTVRNWIEWDRVVPNRIGAGQGLWEGLGERSNDFGAILDDQLTLEMVQRERPDLRYGTPPYDSYLLDKAVTAIADHPGHYARIVLDRLLYASVKLRNIDWIGEAETLPEYNARTGKTRWSYLADKPLDASRYLVVLAWEPLLFLIAVLTTLAAKQFRRQTALLWAVVVGTALPFIVLHIEPQYLLPASFAYLIFAGLALDLGLERMRARRT